ncbi:hypothetical protein [Blastococcus sp. TF02A-26]|uniref:hypothetical protein n=1 Tax=Blastococcus sp. TF02A-26 TaxID=2250577 RepID=UPI0011BDA3DE|nr:hypothetical protein [Blastococcus sp. TF02A-26]
MDAVAVLWAVLGVLGLAAAAALASPALRRRTRTGPAAPAGPRPAFLQDDLPSFHAAPPGTPGATPAAARERPAVDPTGATGPSAGRVVAAMGAAALVLLGTLAVIAAVTRDPAGDPAEDGAATPSTSARPVPALPPVPPAPAAGEPGAGQLAALSVPLDPGGWAGRLTFAPVVLERRAVGTTVTTAAVSVTRRTDGTALAHVRLPTWNCLAGEAPADPAAAGCAPGPVEYADLPSPALTTTDDDEVLRLTGRFPTYTRPNGDPPVYTGRVYELTVSLSAAEPAGPGRWAAADGTLFLGTDRAETVPDPGLSAVLRAG